MKYFLLFVVAAIAIEQSHEVRLVETFKTAEADCAKEKNVSTETLTKAQQGVFDANDNKLNCFPECVFLKVGFFNRGSKDLQVDVLKKFAVEKGGDKLASVLDHCFAIKSADLCDTSYQVYKCYMTEINKPGSPFAASSMKPAANVQPEAAKIESSTSAV